MAWMKYKSKVPPLSRHRLLFRGTLFHWRFVTWFWVDSRQIWTLDSLSRTQIQEEAIKFVFRILPASAKNGDISSKSTRTGAWCLTRMIWHPFDIIQPRDPFIESYVQEIWLRLTFAATAPQYVANANLNVWDPWKAWFSVHVVTSQHFFASQIELPDEQFLPCLTLFHSGSGTSYQHHR